MTAVGFVLVALLVSQSAVLARVEPAHIRPSATQGSCKDCVQILQLFTETVSNPDTQELLRNTLDDLCAGVPGGEAREACLSKTKQYLPIASHFLGKFMKPSETCVFFGLCGSLSEGKEEELLTNHIADGDMASVAPVRGTHPVVQISPQCTFCIFIIKKLEEMLPQERTEEIIVKVLDKVCSILPGPYKDQCEHFIDKYGKQLIEFLLSSAAPHTICVLLQLCLFREPPLLEMPPPMACDSCLALSALSRLHLGSNLTDSRTASFLESVCQQYPLAVPKCEVFTQRFGPRLQRILGKQGDALDMCQKEELCVPAEEEAGLLGADRCTWGRDYVCADMRTAQECDSVPFCQKYMWN
ncbi:hypothetical protein COCON_G00160640 [Conger conger]|uniref:Prosaposin n=1 Tax=Conger conger TaxID=82655 RepID=A0A9Q1DA08_CONCO|nr:hypothetical protein COCON_G00160640 [Conger conger]